MGTISGLLVVIAMSIGIGIVFIGLMGLILLIKEDIKDRCKKEKL